MTKNENRPLLAATLDEKDMGNLKFPLYASPKFDGIRMRIFPELGGVSRVHKRLPNHYLQSIISCNDWWFADGEIIVGSPVDPKCFNKTQSAVMSEDGAFDFTYYIFDSFAEPHLPYKERVKELYFPRFQSTNLCPVTPKLITNQNELLEYEEEKVRFGYEGIIVRSIDGIYKSGRSTIREGILLKLKRFVDAEATLIRVEPLERNMNVAETDELGYAKRSSHKANKVADEMAGSLVVTMPEYGEFNVGSGFDEETRKWLWAHRHEIVGAPVTIKFQKAGMKDVPRFPIYKGIRREFMN